MTLNKNEEMCRKIFQELFGIYFNSVRPDWLKNPKTCQNLELDGFNPNVPTPLGVGLAFEYDGEQHSRFTPVYHSCVEDFVYQVWKDSLKDELCKKNGVLLIRIPYYVCPIDFYLRRFIVERLKRKGVVISKNYVSTTRFLKPNKH